MFAKIAMIVIFFAITITVGVWCRKKATDVNGFVLGGREVGPWLTAFAYGTSYFSAVVFVGYAGQFGWKFGMAATWAGIGNAIIGSLLAWVVLGRRTRVMTHHLGAKTMPEFFEKRYGSTALKLVAAVITFVFLIPYTASVYNGLSRLFGMAFDIPYEVCILVMALLTAVYVIVGGYMATAVNDFIQGIIMLVGIAAVIGSVLAGQGGFTEAVIKLSQIPNEVAATEGMQGAYTSMFGPDPLNLLGVVILTSLGTWGLPQMVQKFYAIKSEAAISKGTIISTIFAIVVSGGCYFLGGFGRLFDIEKNANGTLIYDSVIPNMLATLSDVLIGIVVVLVLSASMSTLSSLVLTSSSTITLDLIKGQMVKKMDDKKQLLCIRIFIAVFIIISTVLAIFQYQSESTFIAQLMGISWGALAGAFLAPFMYGLYSKRITPASVWVCFAIGVGLTVSNMFIGFIASPINAGAIAMIAGLIAVPLVSLVTPKPKKVDVDEIFTCYDKEVTVQKKIAISDNEDAK
ncbi:MAG: sodium:solute symporter [Ruminococcaceae bacterium]|nr:sodium:solute symporter [Oscillospiraceae bacterium]